MFKRIVLGLALAFGLTGLSVPFAFDSPVAKAAVVQQQAPVVQQAPAAFPILAQTQDGATLLGARKCSFDSTHYTWTQVILGSFHNSGQPNGYYHRVIANYMGTYTFDQYGNRRNNAESITDWQVRQQSATGTNFGVGNNYWYNPPALGDYDESTLTSEYNYVHGSGLYIWTWMRRNDGKTCVVKYQVT